MFENYLNNTWAYLKQTTLYVFNEVLGLSPNDLRAVAILLITSFFALLILTITLIYVKSLFLMVKNAGGEEGEEKGPEPELTSVESINYNIGLILDLLNRNVSDSKITQIITSQTNGMVSSEQIMQLISALKLFIGLCKEGTFKTPANPSFQKELKALNALAEEDALPALSLLQPLKERDKEEIIRTLETLGHTNTLSSNVDKIPLTPEEEEILAFIESTQKQNRDKTISQLLRYADVGGS